MNTRNPTPICPAKLSPGADPAIVTELEDAGGMLRACVVGIAQMKSGELPRSHARLFYHQLDAAVRLCRECATRPGWGEAREAFLELAELMADERDEARELIDDSSPAPVATDTGTDNNSPHAIFEFMAACREAITEGEALLQRVRDGLSDPSCARAIYDRLPPTIRQTRGFAETREHGGCAELLLRLADNLETLRGQARELF